MAAAQKTINAQAVETPPQVPMFSAAELAAQVPAAEAGRCQVDGCHPTAIYDVISGPAGGRDVEPLPFTVSSAGAFHAGGEGSRWRDGCFLLERGRVCPRCGQVFAKEPFYEKAIVNQPETYGNVAQVFSSYESRHSPGEKPFERGINTIQLLNDGKRWWVVSILWDSERSDNPLPARLAAKH